METDTPQLRATKGSLLDSHLRGLTPKYRRDLAFTLLFSGTGPIPATWVTNDQQRFLDLRADEDVGSAAIASSLLVVDQVLRLCGVLVPALIESFLRAASPAIADRSERAYVRRCGSHVCAAIFRTCPAWPDADPSSLSPAALSEVRQALTTALELWRSGPAVRAAGRPHHPPRPVGAGNGPRWPVNHGDRARRPDDINDRHRWPGEGLGPVLRLDQAPASDLDFTDRQTTRATSSDAMARRYDWLEARRHRRTLQNATLAMVALLAAPAMFVALVLGLRHVEPDLTVDQQTRIVTEAFKASAGLTAAVGVGLTGRLVWTRLRRRQHG